MHRIAQKLNGECRFILNNVCPFRTCILILPVGLDQSVTDRAFFNEKKKLPASDMQVEKNGRRAEGAPENFGRRFLILMTSSRFLVMSFLIW